MLVQLEYACLRARKPVDAPVGALIAPLATRGGEAIYSSADHKLSSTHAVHLRLPAAAEAGYVDKVGGRSEERKKTLPAS